MVLPLWLRLLWLMPALLTRPLLLMLLLNLALAPVVVPSGAIIALHIIIPKQRIVLVYVVELTR